jgi:hypothetical protein
MSSLADSHFFKCKLDEYTRVKKEVDELRADISSFFVETFGYRASRAMARISALIAEGNVIGT